MKRWPTIPVAPRIPIGSLFFMAVNPPVYRSMRCAIGKNPLWLEAGTLRRYIAGEAGFGRMGMAEPSPATVVHSRTYHRFTSPLVT